MTAAQLARLAELAALAADFFAVSDPGTARTFGDTAPRADSLSAALHRDETEVRNGSFGSSMCVPLGVDHSPAL